jgi:hypothetical protein
VSWTVWNEQAFGSFPIFVGAQSQNLFFQRTLKAYSLTPVNMLTTLMVCREGTPESAALRIALKQLSAAMHQSVFQNGFRVKPQGTV